MYKLVILIESIQDPEKFEELWPRFLLWAEQMPGLRRETTSHIDHTLFGKYAAAQIHELYFDDRRAAEEALASPMGTKAGQMLQVLTDGRLTLYLAAHHEDEMENIQKAREKQGAGETAADKPDANPPA